MTVYDRREKNIRTVEFVVPAHPPYGVAWAEVAKAIDAAKRELQYAPDEEMDDDAVWLKAGDDEIIVTYTKEEMR